MMASAGLDDLTAFAAVARAGSFTRAAAERGTSTSNLSHTIRRLEARLGQRLLQRNSRNVSMTEAGEALLLTLGPALDSIAGALDAMERGRNQVGGTLRLTATCQAYDAVVRPVLPTFLAAHPEAVVEVLVDYRFRDLVADRLDAGIRLGEKLEQDVIALKVGPDFAMAVVASPDYLASAGPVEAPCDLVRHRCINYRMVSAGTIYAWEFDRDGSRFDVGVTGPLTFNDPVPMLDAAVEGLGVAYLPDYVVAPLLKTGRLVRLLADWTSPFPGFHLYYSSRRQMRPVLSAFIGALRRSLSVAARD